jgi:hypothetical protein
VRTTIFEEIHKLTSLPDKNLTNLGKFALPHLKRISLQMKSV